MRGIHDVTNSRTMAKRPEDLDEYRLAEYLAGDLSPVERSSISAYLADDASARELLSMAGEAMDAASSSETDARKRRQGVRKRPPFMLQSQRSVMRLVIGLIVLTITFGFALFLHILEELAPTRTPDVPSIEVQWTPVLRSDHFSISWSAVEGAEAYVVVVMDPTSEHMVARIETSETSIPDLFDRPVNETALTKKIPRSGEIMDLWISAFDRRGNLLRRSDRIPFVTDP